MFYIKFNSRIDDKKFAENYAIAHHNTNYLSGVQLYESGHEAKCYAEHLNGLLNALSENYDLPKNSMTVEVLNTEEDEV